MVTSPKEKSLQTLINEADDAFSLYVRAFYADDNGKIRCSCGCGAYLPWKKMQNGHFVVRGNNTVRWDNRNAAPVTMQCNYFDPDQKGNIGIFINRVFGEGTTEEIERLGKTMVKLIGGLALAINISNIIEGVFDWYLVLLPFNALCVWSGGSKVLETI